MFKSIFLAAASCLCLNAAAIAYTDFGPGQSYNALSGFGIESGFQQAPGFIATATGALNQIDVPLAHFQTIAPTLPLTLMLETDTGGFPSGTILESWTLPGASVTCTSQIFSFASVLNPIITSGTQYWLVASTSDVNGFNWQVNDQGVLGNDYNNGSGSFQYQPAAARMAFDILVGSSSTSPVPEPGSAALLGLGTIALLGISRYKQRTAGHKAAAPSASL